MNPVQAGILAPLPELSRYLFFQLKPGGAPLESLRSIGRVADGDAAVAGIGPSLALALGKNVDGLRTFPPYTGPGLEVPSTPFALFFWLRGNDRGELMHRTRRMNQALSPAFLPAGVIDAFQYARGRDLTGYEDGTENPKGDRAAEAAVVRGQGPGMDGSSFLAVQQWVHDLDYFESLKEEERDRIIGRRIRDNEEIKEAPPAAHVQRAAQESFDPEAFILRRSMPWADETRAGLVFTAFGKSFDAFEAILKRMVGEEDGIPDALFRFTRPVSGAYFWCPPTGSGGLDLRAIGL